MALSPHHLEVGEAPVSPPSRRGWGAKFGDTFRGLKRGIRGQSSFFVHFFFAALAIAAGIVLRCDVIEWAFLVICIGFVLTAELFNSALETLVRGLDEAAREKAAPCLDIAAGAVFLASLTAVIVGSLIFLNRLAGEIIENLGRP